MKVVICIVVVLVVVEQLGHGDAEGGCAGGCALHDLLAAVHQVDANCGTALRKLTSQK